MITTTERASGLTDLMTDAWLVVATKDNGVRDWHWFIPHAEEKAFRAAVGHGDIISPQRRDRGGLVLLAKLRAGR